MKTRKTFVWVLCAVIPLPTLLCMGGSTEIGNARTSITGSITDNGKSVDSVQVQLVAEDYLPGGAIVDKVFSTLTGCRGDYRFENVPQGTYYLNAKGRGKKLLRGPIEITADETDLSTDVLQETSQLTMGIPGNRTVNTIYLLGTTRSWTIESDTTILDSVPSGMVKVVAYLQKNDTPPRLSLEDSVQITITVRPAEIAVASLDNAPPQILTTQSELSRAVALAEGVYSVAIRASDPEGGQVRFRLVSAPNGMSIDSTAGTVRWTFSGTTTAGEYPVDAGVADEKGASRTIRWTVIVAERRIIVSSVAGSVSGTTGRTYLFQADTSVASTATACRYSWGDGDTSTWMTLSGVAHAWKSAGDFMVKYQVQHTADGTLSPWSGALTMHIVDSETLDDTIPPVITLLYENDFIRPVDLFVLDMVMNHHGNHPFLSAISIRRLRIVS